MEAKDLFIICMVCFFIILMVIGVNYILWYLLRKDLQKQMVEIKSSKKQINQLSEDMDFVIKKIKNGLEYKIEMNLLDLQEFKNMEPYLKEAYKKYFVSILMPAVMDYVNKNAKNKKWTDNEIKDLVTKLSNEIRYNGINNLSNHI